MGQPPLLKPYGGAYYSFEGAARSSGGGAYLGLYKDLLPSIAGIGVSGEGYAGGAGDGSTGGVRALADLRGLMVKAGLDYSVRTRSVDWIFSFNAPFRRGGLLGHGTLVRLDWIPQREGAWQVGVIVPFERHMGKTRPRDTEVDLPRAPPSPPRGPVRTPASDEALGQVRIAARWIFSLTHVFWEDSREDRIKSLERTRREIREFKALIGTRDARRPEGVNLAGEVARLHREMARAFGMAVGNTAQGTALQDLARAAMADEVVLPYNRLYGQWKRHDSLLAFGPNARARFLADARREGLLTAPGAAAAAGDVFDGYLRALDDARAAWSSRLGHDSRLVFLPLQLVLQPWEHDSQEKIDALIGRATGTPFTTGNRIDYITGRQFQSELLRSIHEAEDYHVLWLHDYPGLTDAGEVDLVGFSQAVDGYLAALTERVRLFDATRRLPVYMILLDEKYYAQRQGRLFMDLLEDPLGPRIKLPGGFGDLQQRADTVQDSLRQAVAGSQALQEEAGRRGKDWLRKFVKVHVNIMNPMDFSYRTSRLVSHLPIAPDTIIRDHRKIAFRDISEADPGRGEALFPGVAVSEQYATNTWEDRAIRATGPALLSLKDDARRYLVQNGFREADIPAPLRAQPRAPDYDERMARLEAAGAEATAVQVHNDRGFARKNASLVNSMLYTLMPPGSLLVVPSSLWTDPVWAGQLVGAALRGCYVYVITPASDNAPQGGFVAIARTREVFTRFFAIQEQLGPEIEAAGGRLRSGLYTRRTASDEMDEWLRDILDAYTRFPFLADEFPLAPSFFRALQRDPTARAAAAPGDPAPVARDRGQQLHRKTQFLATRESLLALNELVATPGLLYGPFYRAARGEPLQAEDRARLAVEEAWLEDEFVRAHRSLPDAVKARAIYYLTAGSLNIDTRGHVLDGEVMYVLSGAEALTAYTDFAALVGSTTWIESQDQLDRLLPPVTRLKRMISRWVRKSV